MGDKQNRCSNQNSTLRDETQRHVPSFIGLYLQANHIYMCSTVHDSKKIQVRSTHFETSLVHDSNPDKIEAE